MPLLEGIESALAGRDFTIFIIDDGSRDGTLEKIEFAQKTLGNRLQLMQRVKTLPGCQRGSALFDGMKEALKRTAHRIFVELDGDLSHRTEELTVGIGLIESGKGEVVIASKYLPGSQVVNRSQGRTLVSSINTGLMRLVMNPKITDYSNGYRFYTRKAASILAGYQIRYGSPIYLSEALGIWMNNQLKVVEFPSTYIGRQEGFSKVKPIDLIKGMLAVFEIGFRYRFRRFNRNSN